MPIRLTPADGGVSISVKVVPGASRDRVVGALGDALKIAVAKPPEGGAANRAVIQLLAESLGVPASSLEVVRGMTTPRKEIVVRGVSMDEARRRLAPLLKR